MTETLRRIWFRGRSASPIGLDLSPTALRAAQLSGRGPAATITRLTAFPRREDERGQPASDGFAERVRRSLRQAEYLGTRAVAGLSVPDLELHALDLPDCGELQDAGSFADAARWETERVMGVPAGQAAVAYWRLPPSKATKTTAMGVAVRVDAVEGALDLSKQIGLECERVDAAACALARVGSLARRTGAAPSTGVWSVLDLGQRLTRQVVCVDDAPVLARTLGSGGSSWTESIAAALGVSAEAAETHKRDFGIATKGPSAVRETGSSDTPPAEAEGQIAAMILSILRGNLENLAMEIERSYEYVLRCYPDRPPAGVLLVGGGADLRGLGGHFAKKLGVEVHTLDEVVRGGKAPLSVAPEIRESLNEFAVAIGLSIDPGDSP